MIQSGVGKVRNDHRDYDFARSFGVIEGPLPAEYNCDAGLGFPDQNDDGYPMGCTGYTQSELAQDEDGARYKPSYTYEKTLFMEGNEGQAVGVSDMRDSLNSTIVYGVQAIGETTDTEAETHRRGAYFRIEPTFQGVRDALWHSRIERRSVSVATPWYLNWDAGANGTGIIPQPNDINNPTSWHNHKICGWKTINGQTYLISKCWQGPSIGDHGYLYFSEAIFNQIMTIPGTGAFTLAKYAPSYIKTVRLTILQTIISYLRMLLGKI